MIEPLIGYSILGRAQREGFAKIVLHNLRDYSTDKWHRVDDYPFGGEAGMVMKIEPVVNAIESLQKERTYDEVIYTSPDGERFSQGMANDLSLRENLLILCGHYKGIDHRIREHFITREISVGDYVLTGGELPAALMTDAIVRLLPGVLGDAFCSLDLAEHSTLHVHTRPAEFRGWRVPDILLSGHEAKINAWRESQALERTKRLRPDLLKKYNKKP